MTTHREPTIAILRSSRRPLPRSARRPCPLRHPARLLPGQHPARDAAGGTRRARAQLGPWPQASRAEGGSRPHLSSQTEHALHPIRYMAYVEWRTLHARRALHVRRTLYARRTLHARRTSHGVRHMAYVPWTAYVTCTAHVACRWAARASSRRRTSPSAGRGPTTAA